MSYHPRIEQAEYGTLLTVRCRNSELWFVNNKYLEDAILGYVAKFANRYQVILYALAIEGNHLHVLGKFPKKNMAEFMRDLNSCVARAVPRFCPTYSGGRLWARRYSQEFVPGNEDIEDRFFYVALQPVQDGLVERISHYPDYNCFNDAIKGIVRKFTVVNWAKLYEARRWNPAAPIKDFIENVSLKYERLPGYEGNTKEEYIKILNEKLATKQAIVVQNRYSVGKNFLGSDRLKKTSPGSVPKNSKISTRHSHRPRVLSICHVRRNVVKTWYFSMYAKFKEASSKYLAGDLHAEFPNGMYRPYISTSVCINSC